MNALGMGAINQGWRIGIKAKEARIGGGGDGLALQGGAGGGAMRALERGNGGLRLGRAVLRQRVAFGVKPMVYDFRQRIAQINIL